MNAMTNKALTHKSFANKTVPMTMKTFATRVLGVFFLAMSVSVFSQGIPLMFVFTGVYLGVPAEAPLNDMDTMVWLLTSIAMMIVAVYAFITWMKFLWRRFITNPKPLFQSFKRKGKHA